MSTLMTHCYFPESRFSATKRGQNLDCRDWKSDLQNPAVEKGVMWHVSIAPACDVHQFFAPSSTLDGFDISSVIRHQERPSSEAEAAASVWSPLTSTILWRGSNYSSFHAPFFGDWISSKRTKEEAFGLRGRRGRLPFPAVNLLPIHQSQRDMSMSD